MRACLYCRRSESAFSTKEHFVPERLGKGHPFVLPAGAVCDSCQTWASQKIDPAVWKGDAAIRGCLFVARTRGKRGPTQIDASGDTLEPAKGALSLGIDQRTPAQRRGEGVMFSRALVKMALGTLEWCYGATLALSSDYDVDAHFLRHGQPDSIRPFARALGRWLDPAVSLAVSAERGVGHQIVTVQLHGVTFWVSLGDPNVLSNERLRRFPGVHRFNPAGEAECIGERTWLTTKVFRGPDGVRLETAVRPLVLDRDGRIDPSSFELAPIQSFDILSPAWAGTSVGA